MKPTTGATPLSAFDAVVFDTETTSLDTSVARILEIAGVSLATGEEFAVLVNPQAPVPPASSAIHGITAATVADAPVFAEALAAFNAFAQGRVLIAYSVGYDLAILAREADRAGLAWTKPRSLCLRLLSVLANPSLPDYSLDMIAGWLGVCIAGRHRALGDARAASAIFTAILPHLAARGIRTLAEAERACLSLSAELETHHRAGWSEPVTRPGADTAYLGSVDPYAYRHRVGEIMSAPPLVMASAASLREAIAIMANKRISSIFVAPHARADAPVGDYGIVTERDVMRRIASDGAEALDTALGAVATRPLASIREGAFVYRAVGRMARLKIRHLAVRTEEGRLAGIVSARDLLRLRAGAAVDLDDAIEEARTASELAAAWALLSAVAEALLAEDIDASLIAGIVSEELRAMMRRAADIAQSSMAASGLGTPPCPFAVLVLGSGGRSESLLAADQDNAILFAEGAPEGPEDRWFAELGARMAAILDQAGIPLCKGGVMAKNPQWRGSVETWRARVHDWVTRSRPEDLLNVDIFYDLRPVSGEIALAADMIDHAYAEAHRAPAFAKLLGEQLGALGSPFTFLGTLQTEDGRIDLKKFGLFPIVSGARTLAIRHDIRTRSTRERLEGLAAKGIGAAADLQALPDAHALFLRLMLAQQSRDLHSGIPVSNCVDLARLTRDQTTALKAALKRVQLIPAMVRDLMFSA